MTLYLNVIIVTATPSVWSWRRYRRHCHGIYRRRRRETRRIDRKLTQPERRSPHEVNMGENIFDIKINKLTFSLFLSCSLCVLSLCTSLSLNWKLCLYLSLNLCLSVSFYYYTLYLSLLFFCYLGCFQFTPRASKSFACLCSFFILDLSATST